MRPVGFCREQRSNRDWPRSDVHEVHARLQTCEVLQAARMQARVECLRDSPGVKFVQLANLQEVLRQLVIGVLILQEPGGIRSACIARVCF
jgi:hypothetical protein